MPRIDRNQNLYISYISSFWIYVSDLGDSYFNWLNLDFPVFFSIGIDIKGLLPPL